MHAIHIRIPVCFFFRNKIINKNYFSFIYDTTSSLTIQECTMELRASFGEHIRFVFYPIGNDYDHDYFMSIPRVPCLKIRDVLFEEILCI